MWFVLTMGKMFNMCIIEHRSALGRSGNTTHQGKSNTYGGRFLGPVYRPSVSPYQDAIWGPQKAATTAPAAR